LEPLAIASLYLISRRQIDVSEIPLPSGLGRLLVAAAAIMVAVFALQIASTGYSAGPAAGAAVISAQVSP
jgi:hypothetical protein